ARPTAAAGSSRRDATVLSRRSGAVPSRARRPWSAYAIESQGLDRVLLEDQVVNLGPEVGRLEVLEPAIRRDERKVGAEQHLVLELAVRIAHELFREILRRPAGEIDVNVRLVQANRQRLVLPGPGRVRDDHRHVREVRRDVVEVDRVGVFELQSAAAGHSRADARMAAVEYRGKPVFGDDLVERIRHAVIGKESLDRGMKLESPNAAVLDEAARLA